MVYVLVIVVCLSIIAIVAEAIIIRNMLKQQEQAEDVANKHLKEAERQLQIVINRQNIIDLDEHINLPMHMHKDVKFEDVFRLLMEEMTPQIARYMDIETEKDPQTMSMRYTARLKVVDKNE